MKNFKNAQSPGWSQEELADRVGVTRQAISRWESDAAKPEAEKIIALCDLFGISADYLLRDQYNGEPGITAPAPRRITVLEDALRSLTLRQWSGIACVLLGVVVMWFLIKRSGYHQYSFDKIFWNHTFTRLLMYLKGNHLEWLFCLAVFAVICGCCVWFLIPMARKIWERVREMKRKD